ncbi:MAG: 16S rRNA (cytosine(1402)-N(4))-methyltransferase RsmH [Candidatus Pacebacteria bacterium]|nr:16S rRNA (cytosine(1402)-N(4))-methyltransferase RsmH [Candidatus Paceibacterota bacterium]
MHKPVLLNEVIKVLDIQPGDTVLDGTVGGGGYLEAICELAGKKGIVIGLDQDKSALERVEKEECVCQRYLTNENFRNLGKVLDGLNIEKVDKIVFDLGLSSDQLENSGQGFSFQKDEPLLMTFKSVLTKDDLTAEEIVNNWNEQNLADIIYAYGEERFAKRIAKQICEARRKQPIKTTFDLLKIIKTATPERYRRGKTHFATKTFQALRITVNDEIGALKEGLEKGFERLNKGGRMAVISFHSLEDRAIKRFFKQQKNERRGILIAKKPIIPSKEEIQKNPRARSAKLRGIQKL